MIVTVDGEKFVIFRLGDTLEQIAWEIIDIVLENNDGSISAAARALGLNRTTLTERLKVRKPLPPRITPTPTPTRGRPIKKI